ncbi:hypothetical protein WJX72_007637 [[Myrmecia] bisecta]|uniref:ubiquitinyl hydrolase 1 n=1 Tax=[Myrmecia] bisecta TaxID=41462 RepID=A0AAW1QRG8_9CHLO
MSWRLRGNQSPDRVSTFSAGDDNGDGAESRPLASTGNNSFAEGTADNLPKTSVSSVSAAAGDSCGSHPAAENDAAEASSKPEQIVAAETSSRPTDAEIIAQENAIRASEADKLPFVGDVEPLSALAAEYQEGSRVFLQKIHTLEGQYSSIRRARGDGNCFFRSFIFAFFEHLVNTNDLAERNRVVTCIRQWRKKMIDSGFQELVFEDAMEVIFDQLNSLDTDDPLTVASLEGNMRDGMLSNMVVMLLRMLTSCEIQRREDFFAPFIMGMSDDALSVEQFRRRCVEPMGEESDHVHIVALTDALQIPIRVVYLDRSMGAAMAGVEAGEGASVNHHDFIPDACAAAAGGGPVQPRVHVLYRPGHYDILYPYA